MEFVGIEPLSLVDYDDKLSCTLFTSGCNFKCPFCHNSELVLNPHKQKEIPFEEILSYLQSRKGMLDAVVITGGEPTLMKDLKEKIIVIKKMGFEVKLDTNGTSPEVVKDLIDNKLVDYVAMDIKNSFAHYGKSIGLERFPIDKIKETIDLLKLGLVGYEFRTTLVKEDHTKEDIEEIGKMLEGSKRYVLQHFVSRETCIKQGLHEVDKKTAEEYQKILQPYIEVVDLRSY